MGELYKSEETERDKKWGKREDGETLKKKKEKQDRWQNMVKGKEQALERKAQKWGGWEQCEEVLDSPPLGLISFCILCCVPAG